MKTFSPLIPLVVPSFSSKGNILIFDFEKQKHISDNYSLLKALDIKLAKTYLVSAYDIYYGLMPENIEEWPETEYLFVDSGGYEINDSYDISERNKYNYNVFPWNEELMLKVYDSVCNSAKFKNSHIVLSSFDSYSTFQEQLENAQTLHNKFPAAFINCIIKCKKIDEFIEYIKSSEISKYNITILGVAEKELGRTVKERLINLITIRRVLYEQNWNGFLHVFGGMEPNLIKLYYAAGADIFDGLAWQRYWLEDNTWLLSKDKYNIDLDEYENKYNMMCENLFTIQNTEINLSVMSKSRIEVQNELEKILLEFNNLKFEDIFKKLEV